MKLAFIGTGNVGGTLAIALSKKGHAIFLAARDPSKPEVQKLAAQMGAVAQVVSVERAILEAEVVILATPWSATSDLVKQYSTLLRGKILVDCTNPLKKDLSGLEICGEDSGAESLQRLAPEAKVVKCFNSTGFNIMQNPKVDSRSSVMFACSNDAEARHRVKELSDSIGFETIEAGELKTARLLEPYALLWIQSAYKFGLGRDFSFGLLKK